METVTLEYVLPPEHFDRIWALAMVYLRDEDDSDPQVCLNNALGRAAGIYFEALADLGGERPATFDGLIPGEITTKETSDRHAFVVKFFRDPRGPMPPQWLVPLASIGGFGPPRS